MSYTPALLASGYTGWKLLQRTMAVQTTAFNAQAAVKSDEAYFREKIGQVTTAEQLVGDRRLLKVALGAFGLSDDINNKYFIRKVLEGSTLDSSALANKLSDKKYLAMAKAFGFGDYSVPRTKLSYFADEVLGAWKTRSFEEAVGEQDESLRLAMNTQRELAALAGKSSSDTTKWYTILGDAPLREVFETALGLPGSFAQIDLDKQLEVIRAKAKAQLGSSEVAQFSDPVALEKLVRRYLVRNEVNQFNSATSPAQTALTLMQAMRR